MFAKSLRATLTILGLIDEEDLSDAPLRTIADLDLSHPAEAFEALRRVARQAEQALDLAA